MIFILLNEKQVKKEANRQKWIGYIRDQDQSGLSQKKWCAENQINHHNFRYWKQRLKQDNNNGPKENDDKSTVDETFQWASLVVNPEPDTGNDSRIQLEMNGVVLSVSSSFDDVFLIRLIRTLKRI